jgi:1,4-alpha-glucan branching enzyme
MPYVLSHGTSPHGADWVMETAAECYVPILHVLERLFEQGIRPNWTINLTPVLLEQLEDDFFKEEFEKYCQRKIDAARNDLEQFRAEGPLWTEGLAMFWLRRYEQILQSFQQRWKRSIPSGFRHFQDVGSIEIIACAATHGYLPLLGTDESVQAQIQLGIEIYKQYFGRQPKGFWLPECAYRPPYAWRSPVSEEAELEWARKGIDQFLAEEGIEYFFVDSHMVCGGVPTGTYQNQFPQLRELLERSNANYVPPIEDRSQYELYALPSGVRVFSRDPETATRVWSGHAGYPGDEWYLEFHKQHYPGRLRYWRISPNKDDLGAKQPYDPWKAFERIQAHAADFLDTTKRTLKLYADRKGKPGVVVAIYDTELFGHWWAEGPEFLYELAVLLQKEDSIETLTGSQMVERVAPSQHIVLPEGSWGEAGYHYVWLNDQNYWCWKQLYPAERRLRELVRRTGRTEEATRVLDQIARELLLAESSDWEFLITNQSAGDYAANRFRLHIDRFNRLADLALKLFDGGELTADEWEFVEVCEREDSPFQTINLERWAKLERPLGAAK